eukprot:15474471-Alexandrium_andersonii.AAC.1
MIERAVQDVQAQVRTLRDASEGRYGERLRAYSYLIPWTVRHAGNLISRFERDGMEGLRTT